MSQSSWKVLGARAKSIFCGALTTHLFGEDDTVVLNTSVSSHVYCFVAFFGCVNLPIARNTTIRQSEAVATRRSLVVQDLPMLREHLRLLKCFKGGSLEQTPSKTRVNAKTYTGSAAGVAFEHPPNYVTPNHKTPGKLLSACCKYHEAPPTPRVSSEPRRPVQRIETREIITGLVAPKNFHARSEGSAGGIKIALGQRSSFLCPPPPQTKSYPVPSLLVSMCACMYASMYARAGACVQKRHCMPLVLSTGDVLTCTCTKIQSGDGQPLTHVGYVGNRLDDSSTREKKRTQNITNMTRNDHRSRQLRAYDI